ncbi:MAG: hypothetical protein ACRDNS_32660 [Trebonia sp.]
MSAHGEWGAAVALMPFSERTVQQLMAIADHPVLSKPHHAAVLPPTWTTLAVLARLSEGALTERIAAGDITPDLDRAAAAHGSAVGLARVRWWRVRCRWRLRFPAWALASASASV